MTPHDQLIYEIRQLRMQMRAMMMLICILIVVVVGQAFAGDADTALADRSSIPQSEWPYIYYFGTETADAEQRELLAKVLAFTICSLNDEVVIEHQLPRNVNGVYRIDTRQLGWESLPALLRDHYPYTPERGQLPLVVRADWFVQFAMDQEVGGDAYFRLLFGKDAPGTLDQFLSLLETQPGSKFEHGHIEDQSGVANSGTRLIATIPTKRRSDLWITYDAEELNTDTDPLEHLDRSQKFDASEIIGALPKTVSATGEIGHLQVYALSDSAGKLQNKAPAAIVTDHTGLRGVEIRNASSCIACHLEGLRPLSVNALREFVKSGAEAYADYKSREQIERFHLTQLGKLIERHNEDYAAVLLAINGLTPEENAKSFASTIKAYDKPLTIDDAARELTVTPRELALALAKYGQLPARVAKLAQGGTIQRSQWEFEYRTVVAAVRQWQHETGAVK